MYGQGPQRQALRFTCAISGELYRDTWTVVGKETPDEGEIQKGLECAVPAQ